MSPLKYYAQIFKTLHIDTVEALSSLPEPSLPLLLIAEPL